MQAAPLLISAVKPYDVKAITHQAYQLHCGCCINADVCKVGQLMHAVQIQALLQPDPRLWGCPSAAVRWHEHRGGACMPALASPRFHPSALQLRRCRLSAPIPQRWLDRALVHMSTSVPGKPCCLVQPAVVLVLGSCC